MAFTAVNVEGGLVTSDLLDAIAAGEAQGQRVGDFHINGNRRLTDEIQSTFSDARLFWEAFQRRLSRSRESRTTLTREDWMAKLLGDLLGFEQLSVQRASSEAGGQTFFISHRNGDHPNATPVHIVSLDQRLDQRDERRRSPHSLVQEYLNRSEALWGIVTNGSKLRLLRNTVRLSKPTFLEFDLQGMIESNQYSEFALLYRLIHASRFPQDYDSPSECFLEEYYQQGLDEGNRVREKLREGVEDALKVLGTAFLSHPDSAALRRSFENGRLNAANYYRQLLRLVYRLLFLMVAEERKLIAPENDSDAGLYNIYLNYYSVAQLRYRAERYFAGDDFSDLWAGLRETFRLFRDNGAASKLGLSALNGELFGDGACADLEDATCANEKLLTGIFNLSTFREASGQRRRVNYAGLDVEEFGSVYESLLDFHPQVDLDSRSFDLVAGSERKQTGSYYTPPELVRELIGSALVPVVEERLSTAKDETAKEQALLGLRVCDPAAGSGHFVLAAARRIARELARARTGEEEPPPTEYRIALRDVIRNCIYAVDKNPLAVDLCKVALWIEGHNAGLPLSFLDNHIKCGESLVGVANLSVLSEGIPNDAYKPVTGDDKSAATAYRKRNQEEKKKQRQLELGGPAELEGVPLSLAEEFGELGLLAEATPDDVHAKAALYDSLRGRGTDWFTLKTACDLWTAAFFLPLQKEDALHLRGVPTTNDVREQLRTKTAHGELVGRAVEASSKHAFFHWPIEFPDVFENGGFDIVLGNPPWERIKLQEQEFFAGRDREIAKAPNKAARERLIKALESTNPSLAVEFEDAKHDSEAASKFVRGSGRFPLAGRGDVNTYSVFAETMRGVMNPSGRAGFIVPSGIATDDTTRHYFADLIEQRSLASLFDFENRNGIFQGVHRSYKFSLVTLTGKEKPVNEAEFAFFLLSMDQLGDDERCFSLSARDFALINPNTRTCPIFRSKRDSEITRAIYERVPVLIDESKGAEGNPWGIRFMTMFHMSNDSRLFRTREQLESEGWVLTGNMFTRGCQRYVPIYEGKMVDMFDHRAASVMTNPANTRRPGQPVETSLYEHMSSSYYPMPQYWVPIDEINSADDSNQDGNWEIVFKSVTSPTNERTFIGAVLPQYGVANSLIVVDTKYPCEIVSACLAANLNSYILDYVARQKIGGVNLNFFYVQQFSVLAPYIYGNRCQWLQEFALNEWLTARILELTYTAWDLQLFAEDMGYSGPPFRWDTERRFLLRCELDAAFFHLYGIERDDVDYIMDTFPIVRRKDEQQHGEYRTKRVILEIYDAMQRAIDTGQPYQTLLDPPPADPRVAHSPFGVKETV